MTNSTVKTQGLSCYGLILVSSFLLQKNICCTCILW